MLSLLIETWIWWAMVVFIAVCRFISRTLALGSVKRLQLDDWVMLCAMFSYTTFIVLINKVADISTNLLPPNFDVDSLTSQERSHREYGSKLVLVVEQCQILTVWAVKTCILVMYLRLTVARKENMLIKLLAGYVLFGFVFMEIFYFGVWCRPFHNYWAVPTPNMQCNTAINHLITNAVFNLSSDIILLAIALPMFIRSRLPKHQKMALICVFSLGFFDILCAILNKYYSFSDLFGSEWTFWYTRESSTALLVANLPFMWTLLRRVFKFKSGNSTVSGTYSGTPLERMRKDSAAPLNQGVDPESGRQFSDSMPPSISTSSGKEPDHFFLTTPPSFADSWGPRDQSSPTTPTRCLFKDSLGDHRTLSL